MDDKVQHFQRDLFSFSGVTRVDPGGVDIFLLDRLIRWFIARAQSGAGKYCQCIASAMNIAGGEEPAPGIDMSNIPQSLDDELKSLRIDPASKGGLRRARRRRPWLLLLVGAIIIGGARF